jgi:hypothetical protein
MDGSTDMRRNDERLSAAPEVSDTTAQAASGRCLHAAIRLRWHAADLRTSTGAGVIRAVSELLEAVGAEMAADTQSVPDSVRRAALRLSWQVRREPLRAERRSDRSADACPPRVVRRCADPADRTASDLLRLPDRTGY